MCSVVFGDSVASLNRCIGFTLGGCISHVELSWLLFVYIQYVELYQKNIMITEKKDDKVHGWDCLMTLCNMKIQLPSLPRMILERWGGGIEEKPAQLRKDRGQLAVSNLSHLFA